MHQLHLLALPRELRLEIWSYVLTDPSMNNVVLEIRRKLSGPSPPAERWMNSLYKSSILEPPDLCTEFEKPRSKCINVGLLRTSRFIYEDALPTLYHSVIFCLRDLEGILPLFLAPLSPFAKSNIRYIKLSVRESSRCSSSFFYWAVTCAQVAGLTGLRRVDVAGQWPLVGSEYFRQSMLFPLLKIKAPKSFLSEFNVEFQTLLHEAARHMESQALIRKAATAAERAGRLKKDGDERARRDQSLQERKTTELVTRGSSVPTNQDPRVHDNDIASSLDTVTGIQQFEKELLHWNINSHSIIQSRSRTSSLKSTSVQSSATAVQPQTSQETKDLRKALPESIESTWEQSVETLVEDSQFAKPRIRCSDSTVKEPNDSQQAKDLQGQDTPSVGWSCCGLHWRARARQPKRISQRTQTSSQVHQLPATVAIQHSAHSKRQRLRNWLSTRLQPRSRN